MNIDVLKDYLSEEDFLSLVDKLKDTDIDIISSSVHKSEIEALKKANLIREKTGLELMKKSPVDFNLAMSLINLENAEENDAEALVSALKEKHPFLFEEHKKEGVTTSLSHKGVLPDADSLSDRDYYDLIYKKGEF